MMRFGTSEIESVFTKFQQSENRNITRIEESECSQDDEYSQLRQATSKIRLDITAPDTEVVPEPLHMENSPKEAREKDVKIDENSYFTPPNANKNTHKGEESGKKTPENSYLTPPGMVEIEPLHLTPPGPSKNTPKRKTDTKLGSKIAKKSKATEKCSPDNEVEKAPLKKANKNSHLTQPKVSKEVTKKPEKSKENPPKATQNTRKRKATDAKLITESKIAKRSKAAEKMGFDSLLDEDDSDDASYLSGKKKE